MAYLPGFTEEIAAQKNYTKAELVSFLVFHYSFIGFYAFLVALVLVNIW